MNKKINLPLKFTLFSIILIILVSLLSFTKEALYKKEISNASTSEALTVILDAGHGGEDGGAIGNGNVYEKDLNLSITLKIGKLLKGSGINVVYTRTTDTLLYNKNEDYKNKKKILDLSERVKIAEKTENSIFVSIHMNAFSQTNTRGLQVYYSKNDPRSRVIAERIQGAVKTKLQPTNKRKTVAATSRIYLLNNITKPAILIECGFLSNPEECRLLASEKYQNELSKIISEEIIRYVNKK